MNTPTITVTLTLDEALALLNHTLGPALVSAQSTLRAATDEARKA